MNQPKPRRLPLRGRRPTAPPVAATDPVRLPGAGWRVGKFFLGLALLPAVWVLTAAFFENLARANVGGRRFWASESFWFFALGVLLWTIAFVALPQPSWLALRLRFYVFGHELTHALWVWARGGRVSQFKVGRDGGYIVADRIGVFTSLAPYFFPLYSVLVVVAWGLAGVWWAEWVWSEPGRRVLFGLLGATWAFHFTFTLWMIPKDQPDLRLHGTFFSLVVIYLANVLVLTTLFILACPDVTWAGFATDLARHGKAAWHGGENFWHQAQRWAR